MLQISAFPIFTRSGEVSVDLQLISKNVILNEAQIKKTREFVNYTFTSVLRLQKYLMLFNPEASLNNYLIIPTIKSKYRGLICNSVPDNHPYLDPYTCYFQIYVIYVNIYGGIGINGSGYDFP